MIDLTDGTSMYFQEELGKAKDACGRIFTGSKNP